MMAIFAAVLIVGLPMVVLPPLNLRAADDDIPGQPFDLTLLGWGVAAVGLVGLVIGWLRRRLR